MQVLPSYRLVYEAYFLTHIYSDVFCHNIIVKESTLSVCIAAALCDLVHDVEIIFTFVNYKQQTVC